MIVGSLYQQKTSDRARSWSGKWFDCCETYHSLNEYLPLTVVRELIPDGQQMNSCLVDHPDIYGLRYRVLDIMQGKWALHKKQQIVCHQVKATAQAIQKELKTAGMHYDLPYCFTMIRYSLYTPEEY